MAKAKFSREVAASAIDQFQHITYESHGSFSYAAGALGSMLADALTKLPATERNRILSVMHDIVMLNLSAKYTK